MNRKIRFQFSIRMLGLIAAFVFVALIAANDGYKRYYKHYIAPYKPIELRSLRASDLYLLDPPKAPTIIFCINPMSAAPTARCFESLDNLDGRVFIYERDIRCFEAESMHLGEFGESLAASERLRPI